MGPYSFLLVTPIPRGPIDPFFGIPRDPFGQWDQKEECRAGEAAIVHEKSPSLFYFFSIRRKGTRRALGIPRDSKKVWERAPCRAVFKVGDLEKGLQDHK